LEYLRWREPPVEEGERTLLGSIDGKIAVPCWGEVSWL
jgi:hypothetical protein